MIASILRGGLGNQMFIYAMVKAMALRNNTTYSFNLRYGFKNDFKYKRNLELTCLNVNLKENRKATFDYSLGRLCMIISKKTGRNFLIP